MKKSVKADFDGHKPKAIVLDDNARSKTMTARKLRQLGFLVSECGTVEEFWRLWSPGMFDLIVADWQLSQRAADNGDKVLGQVRKRDWDIPFVLVSGKLVEDEQRAKVLQSLLRNGQARFVVRGNDGISKICAEAEELTQRRDQTLLKVILSLRDAAEAGMTFKTTTGTESVRHQLAELVANPIESHQTLRPLATLRGRAKTARN